VLKCLEDLERIFLDQNAPFDLQRGVAAERVRLRTTIEKMAGAVVLAEKELGRKNEWFLREKRPLDAKLRAAKVMDEYTGDASGFDGTNGEWRMVEMLGSNMGDTTLWVQTDRGRVVNVSWVIMVGEIWRWC
jgi:hypothetical protein